MYFCTGLFHPRRNFLVQFWKLFIYNNNKKRGNFKEQDYLKWFTAKFIQCNTCRSRSISWMEDSSFKVEGRSVATVACLYERGNLCSLNKVWLTVAFTRYFTLSTNRHRKSNVTQRVCTGNLETSWPDAVAFSTVSMDLSHSLCRP